MVPRHELWTTPRRLETNSWRICKRASGWERSSNTMATSSGHFNYLKARKEISIVLTPLKVSAWLGYNFIVFHKTKKIIMSYQMTKSISDSRNRMREVLLSDHVRILVLKKGEVVKTLKPEVISEEIMIVKICSTLVWFGLVLKWNYCNKESGVNHKRNLNF